MTTPSLHPRPVLTRLALRLGEAEDRGRDTPATLCSAVVALGLSEEHRDLLTDVVLVAHGLLVGYDATPGLLELYGSPCVTAAAELALRLLDGLDGPSRA
jgi:hypothetical protein